MDRRPQFVRDATGLVRQIGFLDFLAINFGAAAITAGILVSNLSYWFFPNSDAPLGILLAGLLMMVTQIVIYALFSASMPRAGGDYVFVSRTLHPSLGLGANFTAVWSNMWIIGASTLYTQYNISGAVASLGLLTGNSGLVSFGLSLGSGEWIFTVGAITILLLTIAAVYSTKLLMRIVVGLFIVGILGLVVSLFALVSFHGNFVSIFNSFAAPYTNQADSYHSLIQATVKNGYSVGGFSLVDTVRTIPLQLTWLAFAYWSTYNAGEFKKAGDVKREYWSMGVILLFNTVFAAGLIYALESVIGHQFFASMSYAFYSLPSALPFPVQPSLNLFVGMITGNPSVGVIASLGTIAIGISLTAILYPMLTRCLFAWSFDRLVPAKLSDVSQRFGTPYVAIIVCTAIGLASLAINSFILPSLFATISIVTVYSQIFFNFTIVSIGAVVFPYVKKVVYDSSPAHRYHPLLPIAGIASALVFAWSGFEYFTDPLYGIVSVPWEQVYLVAIFAIPFLAYFGIRAIRARQGINLRAVFSDIPPE